MLTRKKRILPRNFAAVCHVADHFSLSDYHVGKYLAGSRYLKTQLASGLRTLNSPTENTPVDPHLCAVLHLIA